jgi:glyoxylase-like metal-dependent hydrolase (beta-lactamase superfamily II)
MPFENYSGNIVFLKEGEKIILGEDNLEVLFTPGHSVGHVVFYNRIQGFVIGGDVLFRMGIGRTDIPGGDTETLLISIREKLFSMPDDVIVYPGHGEPTTIGYEKEFNPFLAV